MGFNCGIVGLPNVGKSTLFNALTQTIAAQAANFPFCTIEPNTGRGAVPDARLDKLAEIVKPRMVTPTQLEFVDIAGLPGAMQQYFPKVLIRHFAIHLVSFLVAPHGPFLALVIPDQDNSNQTCRLFQTDLL